MCTSDLQQPHWGSHYRVLILMTIWHIHPHDKCTCSRLRQSNCDDDVMNVSIIAYGSLELVDLPRTTAGVVLWWRDKWLPRLTVLEQWTLAVIVDIVNLAGMHIGHGGHTSNSSSPGIIMPCPMMCSSVMLLVVAVYFWLQASFLIWSHLDVMLLSRD